MRYFTNKTLTILIYVFIAIFAFQTFLIFKNRNTANGFRETILAKQELETNETLAGRPIVSENKFQIDIITDWNKKADYLNLAQVILLLLGVPVLIAAVSRIRKLQEKLSVLSKELLANNNNYIFNSLENTDNLTEEQAQAELPNNLKKALGFIKSVSQGNYEIQWDGLTEINKEANKETIAGELITMRDQMKDVKQKDEIRIWNTEGLSQFGEIIRKNQNDFVTLSEEIISKVVNYINAQVGGLFIIDKDDDGKESIFLKASYAYDRKKYLSKKIEIGEGIVGQCFIEGATIYMEEVPENYIAITSGLGLSNPKSLLVIPLKANEKIEGVLELASLKKFKPHQIEFLEKLGELLASAISTERTNEKTNELLRISQKQAEEMRTQEEELRQNMEELQSIQENNHRTLEELAKVTTSLEKEKYLLDSLLNNIPDSIYFKDTESKFICVSKYLAERLNYTQEFLTGKSDFDLFDKQHAQAAYDDEHNIMNSRKPKIDYVEQESADQWVSTTKMPLINSSGEVVGTFGISRDVSKFKKLEFDILAQEKSYSQEKEKYLQLIRDLEEKIKQLQQKVH